MTEQASAARLELFERDAELTAVEGLVDVNDGSRRLLAIEGPPGIGKTALIGEAKALAHEAGMQVLTGRGSELERSFAYGVVRQLFEPLVASLPAEERSELFTGAAALAAPLFDPAHLDDAPANNSLRSSTGNEATSGSKSCRTTPYANERSSSEPRPVRTCIPAS